MKMLTLLHVSVVHWCWVKGLMIFLKLSFFLLSCSAEIFCDSKGRLCLLFRYNCGRGRQRLAFPTIPASTWTSDSGWCRQCTFVGWFFPSFGCSQRPLLTVMLLSLRYCTWHKQILGVLIRTAIASFLRLKLTLNGQIFTTDYCYRRNYAKWKCLFKQMRLKLARSVSWLKKQTDMYTERDREG